jgi:hypothetical protein
MASGTRGGKANQDRLWFRLFSTHDRRSSTVGNSQSNHELEPAEVEVPGAGADAAPEARRVGISPLLMD